MKNLIVATFVIIALGSTFISEAKAHLFFPFRFDYKKDRTNDHVVKTLVYERPFSGRIVNFDYRANWEPLPPPPPINLNWDVKWDYNQVHGNGQGHSEGNFEHAAPEVVETTTTTTPPPPPPPRAAPAEPVKNVFTWNAKWDFNHGHHGQGSSNGNIDYVAPAVEVTTTTPPPPPPPRAEPVRKVVTWDAKWNYNRAAVQPTTTQAPITFSSSNNGYKKIDAKWSASYNHGGAATQTSSPENPIDIDPAESEQ